MGGKKMEGSEEQKRAAARAARRHGRSAGEAGATTGASEQRAEAPPAMSHQERIDLKKEGKPQVRADGSVSEARPGSRDADTLDRERHPRL